MRGTISYFGTASWQILLVALCYVSFAAFLILAVSGALVVFHATRARFKYPTIQTQAIEGSSHRIKSYLFYSGIIEVPPEHWARSFVEESEGGRSKPSSAIGLQYLKNYIVESYLVASKVADKLRYLTPAQDLQALSIKMLFLWLILSGITAVAVEPPKGSMLVGNSAAMPITPNAAPVAGSGIAAPTNLPAPGPPSPGTVDQSKSR